MVEGGEGTCNTDSITAEQGTHTCTCKSCVMFSVLHSVIFFHRNEADTWDNSRTKSPDPVHVKFNCYCKCYSSYPHPADQLPTPTSSIHAPPQLPVPTPTHLVQAIQLPVPPPPPPISVTELSVPYPPNPLTQATNYPPIISQTPPTSCCPPLPILSPIQSTYHQPPVPSQQPLFNFISQQPLFQPSYDHQGSFSLPSPTTNLPTVDLHVIESLESTEIYSIVRR